MKHVHFTVTGRVQGVFYRASAVEAARRLGLVGWVRNLPDGRVEAVAEGPHEAIEAFLAWARQGPPAARVEWLEAAWGEPTGSYTGFDQCR